MAGSCTGHCEVPQIHPQDLPTAVGSGTKRKTERNAVSNTQLGNEYVLAGGDVVADEDLTLIRMGTSSCAMVSSPRLARVLRRAACRSST